MYLELELSCKVQVRVGESAYTTVHKLTHTLQKGSVSWRVTPYEICINLQFVLGGRSAGGKPEGERERLLLLEAGSTA